MEKEVQLNLGKVCNNLCKFCMTDIPLNKRKFIPFSQIKKELKQFRDKNYNVVGFLGGELTIYPQIIELVAFADRLGYKRINLVSNGRRYSNMGFLKKLAQAGNIKFYISIHSHEEKTEDFLTSINGGFREKIQGLYNLNLLRKKEIIKEKISVNLVVNKLNYKVLPRTLLFYFKNFDIKDFRLNFIKPDGRAMDNFKILVPTYKKIMPYLKQCFLLSKKMNMDVSSEGIPFCVMEKIKNFRDFVGESKDSKNIIEGEENRQEFQYDEFRKDRLRTKTPKCGKCIYDSSCEGPWTNYAKIYGFKEFKPVIKN